ncbi:type II restriction enzyme [Capilliphycus salinus ALCB114379]|uniref:type II restriction enzyme n=1 Tax=Capilliphycus salinus TaxID=2768948 RepID=UPI0039A505D6
MSNSSKKNLTKNDIAWEKIFEQYQVLEKIYERGSFEIDAGTINQFRESRLMAKFDHHVNLPRIFQKNSLSILPISRSRYILGHFDAYFRVNYHPEIEPIPVTFPSDIESLDYETLSSESLAINCAFYAGMIADILDTKTDKVFHTVSGRMSAGSFDFSINRLSSNSPYLLEVNNSQCEIDAGFETEEYFLIVEAKMYGVEDFLIRQLYYPYRLWSSKVHKKVLVALMTFSNSTNQFSFFLYDFDNLSDYNSIRLIKQKNYIIGSEKITRDDILEVFNSVKVVCEPDVTFPQADDFNRVVDLLTLLYENDLTKDEITTKYQFTARQTNYYTDAGRYLGLVDKIKNYDSKEIAFCLTDEGRSLMNKKHKLKILSLIKMILRYPVFYKTFEITLQTGEIPSKNQIIEIMSKMNYSDKTKDRRSQTVISWMKWILSRCSD